MQHLLLKFPENIQYYYDKKEHIFYFEFDESFCDKWDLISTKIREGNKFFKTLYKAIFIKIENNSNGLIGFDKLLLNLNKSPIAYTFYNDCGIKITPDEKFNQFDLALGENKIDLCKTYYFNQWEFVYGIIFLAKCSKLDVAEIIFKPLYFELDDLKMNPISINNKKCINYSVIHWALDSVIIKEFVRCFPNVKEIGRKDKQLVKLSLNGLKTNNRVSTKISKIKENNYTIYFLIDNGKIFLLSFFDKKSSDESVEISCYIYKEKEKNSNRYFYYFMYENQIKFIESANYQYFIKLCNYLMSKIKKYPQFNSYKIYKYKTFFDYNNSPEYNSFTKKSLEGEVYFSKRFEVNDPFDVPDVEKLTLHRQKGFKAVNEDYGLFCSCKSFLNNKLWDLYADHYCGICIEYTINKIISLVENNNEVFAMIYGDVIYNESKKIPEVIYPLVFLDAKISGLVYNCENIFNKYIVWKDEDEYRFFVAFEKETVDDKVDRERRTMSLDIPERIFYMKQSELSYLAFISKYNFSVPNRIVVGCSDLLNFELEPKV